MLTPRKSSARARSARSYLVCQNQSIEDSDAAAGDASPHRARAALEQGASNDQVMRYLPRPLRRFRAAAPSLKPATILLWATPALALLGGLLAIWMTRRRNAASGIGATELTEAERARLAQYKAIRA